MSRSLYVRTLLGLYCDLPHTALRQPSPLDRRLAAQLFDQAVPLETIEAAFLLAIARRGNRDPKLPPLPAIRSLHYFLPVIDELRHQPLDPWYITYLRHRVDQMGKNSTFRGER